LSTNSDVVAHEFGHHVEFESLQETRGESLVMNEGLTDYFAMARSGDSCLGESICPYNSSINCEVNQKAPKQSCLRSATAVKYVLNENTKTDAHFKSQFISGMLWDLRTGE